MPNNPKQKNSRSWNALLEALRFALPYMEDRAASSDNVGEQRAAVLMREAITAAEES